MFPYIHIREGQARPYWTRLSFRRLLIPSRHSSHLTQISSNVEVESSTYDIVIFISSNAQVKLTGSLGPSASSNVYFDYILFLSIMHLGNVYFVDRKSTL